MVSILVGAFLSACTGATPENRQNHLVGTTPSGKPIYQVQMGLSPAFKSRQLFEHALKNAGNRFCPSGFTEISRNLVKRQYNYSPYLPPYTDLYDIQFKCN